MAFGSRVFRLKVCARRLFSNYHGGDIFNLNIFYLLITMPTRKFDEDIVFDQLATECDTKTAQFFSHDQAWE